MEIIMAVTTLTCPAADASPPVLEAPHQSRRVPVILALDLGTTTGWALRTSNDVILSGVRHFRPNRFEGGGMRYLRFTGWLDDVLRHAGKLDTVVFEEVRAHAGTDAAHVFGGFLGTLTAWCENHDTPYEGVPVATIKRHVTAKGNASKEAVIAAVRALGHNPEDDNEADAIALLRWAIDTHGGVR
jgi:Holliday junction resolvasome RuvABC endonuclease subunit